MSADMNEQDMRYALAKQVPAMRDGGFSIQTAYGEFNVVPSLLADRIANLVAAHLLAELELLRVVERNRSRQP